MIHSNSEYNKRHRKTILRQQLTVFIILITVLFLCFLSWWLATHNIVDKNEMSSIDNGVMEISQKLKSKEMLTPQDSNQHKGYYIAYYDDTEEHNLITNRGYNQQIRKNFTELWSVDKLYSVSFDNRSYRVHTTRLTNNTGYIKVIIDTTDILITKGRIAKTLNWNFGIIVVLSMIISFGLSLMLMRPLVKKIKVDNETARNTSHEFGTHLSLISSSLQMIEMDSKNTNKYINETKEQIQSLQQLAETFILIANAENGTLITNPELISIQNELQPIIENFSNACKSQEKNLVCTTNFLTPIAYVDMATLNKILEIVNNNALQFSDKEIRLNISTTKKNLIIDIENDGESMTSNELQNSFNEFYRNDNSRQNHSTGFGLGLTILKATVIALNGNIVMKILDGGGLKVNIKLPIKQ